MALLALVSGQERPLHFSQILFLAAVYISCVLHGLRSFRLRFEYGHLRFYRHFTGRDVGSVGDVDETPRQV